MSNGGTGSARRRLEHASARPLLFLHQLRWVTPIAVVALLVAGAAVRGWAGAAALTVLAAFLAWLAALSWPALATRDRLVRLASVGCVLAFAAIQALR